MKKRLCFVVLIIFCLFFSLQYSFATDLVITAKDLGTDLAVKDFKLDYASTVKGNGSYESKCLYMVRYQIIEVVIENKSNKIINVNPNYPLFANFCNRLEL